VLKDSNKRMRKGAAKALEKIAKQDKGGRISGIRSEVSMSGTGILSGTLSEKERKTLERLVAEVGDVSEAVRVRLREIEDAEKKLVEMKK